MAYSYETSSVKTINGEVSGLADVVARQAIANLPTLSGGEGVQIVNEDGKNRIDLGLSAGSNMSFVYDQETNTIRLDSEAGKTYTGVAPIVVNNTSNQISADTWSFSAGDGLVFTDDNANKVTKLEVEGETLSAGPGINLFESGGYVVISAEGGNAFPMTGTDGTTNYTANANFSSFTLTTGQGAAGAHVNMNVKGVQYEAYPATDVSASWYNIITQYNNVTCSSVKLSTADTQTRFVTSALPNLNKMTFIAPTYGPYETYSALIDDGSTTFVAEVDSGCCRTVVRCWNDDRNKNCWCGLNQETYFYIG